jgi:ketosteroid isomerase-like protein
MLRLTELVALANWESPLRDEGLAQADFAGQQYFEDVSDENIDIVRRGFETLNRGDFEGFLDLFHPDFVTETPPDLALEPDRYVGPEGIRRWFESFYDAVDEVRFESDDYMAIADKVVVEARLIVRGRDSGIEAEQRMTQVWTMRDGSAMRLETFADREEALEAARANPPRKAERR